MSYLVKKTFNNGYHCCCNRTWDEEKWCDTEAEALAEVPTTIYRDEKHGEWELESIEVTDGRTGDLIAYGNLNWGADRGTRYTDVSWKGKILGKDFYHNKEKTK